MVEQNPHLSNALDRILRYRNEYIVVDTKSPFIFIGKLVDTSHYFITLKDVDVHDRSESPSMNEKYVLDSKKYGVRVNRRLVHIRLDEVISVSSLNDIVDY
jgi:hypothetical protein